MEGPGPASHRGSREWRRYKTEDNPTLRQSVGEEKHIAISYKSYRGKPKLWPDIHN